MATLADARKALAQALGAPATVPDVIDPPCNVVEPGDPYIAYDEHYQYAGYIATCDVYVLVADDDNEAKGDAFDNALMAAVAAIEGTADWGILRIGKPGLHFTADWTAYGVAITTQARVTKT